MTDSRSNPRKAIRPSHFMSAAIFLAIALGSATPADAASFAAASAPGMCTIQMDGAMQAGDADRLKEALGTSAPGQVNLCLNSPGGSFSEALRVIEFIAKAGRPIRTIVNRGAECYSACALVLMGGRDAENKPDRKLHIRGTVGFHAPFIKPGAANYDASVLERANRESLRAIASFLKTNPKEFFPEDLLVKSLLKPPNEFLSVETVRDAGTWQIDLIGYRKPKRLTKAGLDQACASDLSWNQQLESTPNSKDTAPIALKTGRLRLTFKDYGDEAVFICVVDVYSDPAKGLAIDMMLASDIKDKEVPKPGALEARVKAVKDPLVVAGKPLWYTFLPETELKDLAEE